MMSSGRHHPDAIRIHRGFRHGIHQRNEGRDQLSHVFVTGGDHRFSLQAMLRGICADNVVRLYLDTLIRGKPMALIIS